MLDSPFNTSNNHLSELVLFIGFSHIFNDEIVPKIWHSLFHKSPSSLAKFLIIFLI